MYAPCLDIFIHDVMIILFFPLTFFYLNKNESPLLGWRLRSCFQESINSNGTAKKRREKKGKGKFLLTHALKGKWNSPKKKKKKYDEDEAVWGVCVCVCPRRKITRRSYFIELEVMVDLLPSIVARHTCNRKPNVTPLNQDALSLLPVSHFSRLVGLFLRMTGTGGGRNFLNWRF